MFRKSRSLIGLDVGSHSAKAVELTVQGGDYCVTAAAQVELPPGEERNEILANMIRSADFHSRRVVASVSGKSVIVRYLTMPRMTDDELPKALDFEADKYIPFDMSDVVRDCQRLGKGGDGHTDGLEDDKMRVLLVAAKRNVVEEVVQVVYDVGLHPEIVDVDAFALGNAFELHRTFQTAEQEAPEVVALVDVGARKTSINIIQGNESCFTREIYMGGNDFTQAISKRLGMRLEDAESFKKNPEDSLEELDEALSQSLDDLGGEVLLSFDYYENQFDNRVEEVFLSGGSSRLSILAPTFERIFNRRTSVWNPFEHIEMKHLEGDTSSISERSGQMAIALGLASRIRKEH